MSGVDHIKLERQRQLLKGWDDTQGATMTAKEIREAAILMHDWHCKPDDQITYGNNHPWFYMDEDATNADQIKTARLVKDYILANVQEDGEEKVDEAWLREEWGWKGVAHDKITTDIGSGFIYGKLVPHEHGCDYYVANMVISQPATRSQFRSLMKGLGIEPKKISQKNIINS